MEWYLKVLKQYADFDGRARRKEYWMFFLFNIIVSILVGIIAGVIGLPLLGNLYTLAILVPSIAVGVRRVHDTGHSGWFLLIPLYNLYLVCIEGDQGANSYGQDPKA